MKLKTRIVAMALILILLLPVISFANAMEPPGFVLIVEGNTENVDAWITYNDEIHRGSEFNYPLEKQYWFYRYKEPSRAARITLTISNNGEENNIDILESREYRNTYTYNLKTGLLTEGKSTSRSLTLVGARILITLIIEGIIFYVFGFRDKQSWLVFFIINLITQSSLNIYINTIPVAMAYSIFTVIFTEFWIFLGEMIAFPLFIREHSNKRKLGYAVISNFISLILGGFILMILPI